MPVFLVSFRDKKPYKTSGFMEEWGQFIRGPIAHVEIAFVQRGEPVRALMISYASETARFGVRTYANPDILYEWYKLPGVNEQKMLQFCNERDGKDRMSMLKMVKSAMPIDNDDVARMALRLPAVGGISDPIEIERMIESTRALKEGEFCATLSARAIQAGTNKLDDVDPSKLTATDVVAYIVRRLDAVRYTELPLSIIDEPKPQTKTYDVEASPPWMIFSDRWIR
jgi:hypothetical protein